MTVTVTVTVSVTVVMAFAVTMMITMSRSSRCCSSMLDTGMWSSLEALDGPEGSKRLFVVSFAGVRKVLRGQTAVMPQVRLGGTSSQLSTMLQQQVN